MTNSNNAVSIADAQGAILDAIRPLGPENVSILNALNRVLYEDIIADMMIPPMDTSAMDGYAVIAADTLGATRDNPIQLKVVEEIQAGGSFMGKEVSTGTAIRIMTGATMPKGADSVIKVEDTLEEYGQVKIFHPASKYLNYRPAGENIRKSDRVLAKGDRLSSSDIGILASLNYHEVKVYKRPTVSIISTGDEVAGLGEQLREGQIRDVNAYTLCAEVIKYGGLPQYVGIAKDSPQDIKQIFNTALQSDVVISTGGVSMGKYDFVKRIYRELGISSKFEWVKVKPGKPCTFGVKDNRLIFGLPGNPVSTLTAFILFVRPALLKLMGATRINKPIVHAFLQEDITNKKTGKVHLMRGYFTIKDREFWVSTTGAQKPSMLRSMSMANCLIIVPEDVTSIKAGEKVAIQLIDHEEI